MTDAPQPPSDFERWTRERKREDALWLYNQQSSRLEKANEAAVKAADGTFRAGLLINGGAAVAVFAFIGSLATKELIAVHQLFSACNFLK